MTASPFERKRRRNDRYGRRRREVDLAELIELVIGAHKLTEAVREERVRIFWRSIIGDKFAANTLPDAITRGVLRVWVRTSAWVHELGFFRKSLVEKINQWSGAKPLITDVRLSLTRQRELSEPDALLRELHVAQGRPARTPENAPPSVVSEVDRESIRAETVVVADDELRSIIEGVRLRWNR